RRGRHPPQPADATRSLDVGGRSRARGRRPHVRGATEARGAPGPAPRAEDLAAVPGGRRDTVARGLARLARLQCGPTARRPRPLPLPRWSRRRPGSPTVAAASGRPSTAGSALGPDDVTSREFRLQERPEAQRVHMGARVAAYLPVSSKMIRTAVMATPEAAAYAAPSATRP